MIVIGIISIIIYTIAILMIYTNTYSLEKDKKVKLLLIGIIVILFITWIIVLISSSSIKIEELRYLQITKTTSVLIFAPINTIFTLPYFGHVMNQYKQKNIKEQQVKKKLLILVGIFVIIAIMEISYIKNFELGLLNSVK